ncbi:DDE-type integrase/transposase/recombinase [Dinoroseobacter sp. S76]|uniref:DDE-type integrase/transposase/recombinase n=1 Tax=Dinoroseobacter sp. S76 TaxID=3415124 RepID=UPI003C7AF855
MLTVLDGFARQVLAVVVRTKMGADDVLEALFPLLLRHGSPKYFRSDNGPEFAAEAMQNWLRRVGIKPIRSHPGSSLAGHRHAMPCRAMHGRTETRNTSMEHCAGRFPMGNG